jgi:hypothetical protein
MYQRLRQIEVERLNVHDLSASQDLDKLHTAVRRLAALERYSQRSHSEPEEISLFEQSREMTIARNMLLQQSRMSRRIMVRSKEMY